MATLNSNQTYFDTLPKNYTQVPFDNGGIETKSFLEATEGLIKLLDLLGSAAFKPVQIDMSGNVKKIRDRYSTDPAQNTTLQLLVEKESGTSKKTATEGLLWLVRGLNFCAHAIRHSHENPKTELSDSFSIAYESTLKQYHGIMIRPIFSMAMKACPYRADFYKRLGSDEDKVKSQLAEWLLALEKHLAVLTKLVGA